MTRKAVLINDTELDGHYGCTRVVRAIERLTAENGITISSRSPVHSEWQSNPRLLEAMDEADVILVNGEGTIHHDLPAGKRLVDVADHCISIGKPAVLINSSWFSNGADLLEQARRFAIVAVRESESERQLRSAGLACVRMADLALHDTVPAFSQRKGIGVTDSVLPDAALRLDLLRHMHGGEIINLFHSRTGLSGMRFFLRLYGIRQALRDPVRTGRVVRAAVSAFRNQMPDDKCLLAAIAQLDLLVTGRFHAMIFALASLTPLLAIESNTPKISATLKDAGVERWRLRSNADFDRELLKRAKSWVGWEEANIRDFLSDNRARQKQLFKDIAALAA